MDAKNFDLNTFIQEMSELLHSKNKIVSIYQNLYICQDNFYRILNNNEIRQIVRTELKQYNTPKHIITKNLIEKIIYFLETEEIISEDKINPNNKYPLKNGTLVLNNGKIHFNDSLEDIFTFRSNAIYNEQINIKDAQEFLNGILPIKENQCRILEVLAIALFPALRDRINFDNIILCYGTGANGKSVLFDNIIATIFSNHAIARVKLEDFGKRFALAGLLGKRLNIATENNIARIGENAQLKALTSGDVQEIERKHKDAFPAKLIAIPIFSINKEPQINDLSYAMERRLFIINFPNRFIDNPQMLHEFKANPELRTPNSEISKKIQVGLLKLILDTAEKLYVTREMTSRDSNLIAEFQLSTSHHRQFIHENFEFNKSSVLSSDIVFDHYKNFCSNQGYAEEINEKIKWLDVLDYQDKLTKAKDKLTKKLCELFPQQISKERINNSMRGLRGLKLISKIDDTHDTQTQNDNICTNIHDTRNQKIEINVDGVNQNNTYFTNEIVEKLLSQGWEEKYFNFVKNNILPLEQIILDYCNSEKICIKTLDNKYRFIYKNQIKI